MNKISVHAWPALLGGALIALTHAAALAEASGKGDQSLIDRGRYLVKIAGCNDCHTPGYMEAGGKVDEKLWLTGDALGWHGPWGTTYAINLRQYMAGLSETQWLQRVNSMQPRPPMPWFNVQAMSLVDRKAIYHYIRSLGPGGKAAPAWLPPDNVPPPPFIQFPS